MSGAFCEPLPEEMVDRGMPFGPKNVAVEQLENLAESIRPAVKHVNAMKRRHELKAEGRIKSLEPVKAKLAEPKGQDDAEITKLLGKGRNISCLNPLY